MPIRASVSQMPKYPFDNRTALHFLDPGESLKILLVLIYRRQSIVVAVPAFRIEENLERYRS